MSLKDKFVQNLLKFGTVLLCAITVFLVSFTSFPKIDVFASDGSLDTSFNPGSVANSGVLSIASQPDGKILIGGWLTQYNGTTRNDIARLNSDGSLDTSFNPGSGVHGSISSIALQPDGKILIGGEFTQYNGTTRNNIARLNPDGSLDTSFDPGSGADSSISSIALQPDGKILIGGGFTEYNGTPRNNIARLNSSGGSSSGSCVGGLAGTGSSTDNQGYVTICILPGTLSVTVNDCTMQRPDGQPIRVSHSDQTVECTTTATFVDLRGSGAGWSATATMTNFRGHIDNTILSLCRNRQDPNTGESLGVDCSIQTDFSLTPGNMQRISGQPVNQALNENTTTQFVLGLTNNTATGVNTNPFVLGGYGVGGGEGTYSKQLTLTQILPAYTRAQAYNGTLTVSVA